MAEMSKSKPLLQQIELLSPEYKVHNITVEHNHRFFGRYHL